VPNTHHRLARGRRWPERTRQGPFSAVLDRLTHHVHILEMNGDSYRLKQSKGKQKSQPATA